MLTKWLSRKLVNSFKQINALVFVHGPADLHSQPHRCRTHIFWTQGFSDGMVSKFRQTVFFHLVPASSEEITRAAGIGLVHWNVWKKPAANWKLIWRGKKEGNENTSTSEWKGSLCSHHIGHERVHGKLSDAVLLTRYLATTYFWVGYLCSNTHQAS